MPLNIPNNYYQCSMTHQCTGSLRPAIVTFGVLYTGSNFVADIGSLGNAWAPTVMGSMADVWKYTNFEARNALGSVFIQPHSTPGGTAHTPTTPQVTFLVKKETGLGGRRNHGRMYIPGVSEQDVDAVGVVAATKVTELVNGFQAWVTNVVASHFTLQLLHNGAFVPTPVTSLTIQQLAATQRRRLRK